MKNSGFSIDKITKENVFWQEDPYLAAEKSHAIVILTEWDEFLDYDYELIYSKMRRPAFCFDGRGVLSMEKIEKLGFIFYQIGKK